MNFYFYSPVNFEKWDFRTPDIRGIGGSETSHIEMCWRLARRNHKVVSYAPIPKDCPPEDSGVKWRPLEAATFEEPGIWVIYRSPETLEKFKDKKKKNQIVWFVSQDEWYPSWKKKYARVVDKLFALCTAHQYNILKHHPELKGKVFITSNGIKMDLIREIEKEKKIKRDPFKMIFASSPDRGLLALLKTFKKAREFEPRLKLHVFYGFDNMDKLIKASKGFKAFKKIKDDILPFLKQPGVKWRGRVNQKDLAKEWLSAGIWCYQTNFTETSCIVSMEAQALGAIPITNPLWALKDNVMSGVFIDGDAYGDPLTAATYAAEIYHISNKELQEQIRPEMMSKARHRFNWERIVDQWENWLYKIEGSPFPFAQYAYQLKHFKGKVLNVGCDIDVAGLGEKGALNIDILETSPMTGKKNKAHLIADARDLPQKLHGKFDTVILGDILEHMNSLDALDSLKSAQQCLAPDGHIVITCPEDYRPLEEQHKTTDQLEFAPGIPSYHQETKRREWLEDLFTLAGLTIVEYQRLDYTLFEGNAWVVF